MVRQHVLVVDDEEYLTKFFNGFFTDLGYQMQVAANGEEALKVVEHHQSALMLLDMRMVGVDGIQVFKVKKMVERNHGTIDVQSGAPFRGDILSLSKGEVGKGTSFFLEFPGAEGTIQG